MPTPPGRLAYRSLVLWWQALEANGAPTRPGYTRLRTCAREDLESAMALAETALIGMDGPDFPVDARTWLGELLRELGLEIERRALSRSA